jgi:hypothetical protein
MKARILHSLVAGAVLLSTSALAQDNNLARTYTVKPKAGMYPQFEAALREHAQWRAANGDPWIWGVYMPETGADLAHVVIRSGGHTWADFDAYDQSFNQKGLMHWNATVVPLIESISSSISAADLENSSIPTTGDAPAFVNVTTFRLRPGQEQLFEQTVNQASAILKQHGWTNFVWAAPVSGDAGPVRYLATLHPNWADMAEPDPSFAAILIQELGEEGFAAMMSTFGETMRGAESATYRFRPDLSVMGN